LSGGKQVGFGARTTVFLLGQLGIRSGEQSFFALICNFFRQNLPTLARSSPKFALFLHILGIKRAENLWQIMQIPQGHFPFAYRLLINPMALS